VTLSSAEDGSDSLEGVVVTEFDPNARIGKAFTELAANRLPDGHLPREKWHRDLSYIDTDGIFEDGPVLPAYLMPETFQDFASKLSAELHGAANDALGVLRWRSRTLGTRRPFSTQIVMWSLDGERWHTLPTDLYLSVVDASRLHVSEGAASELQALLDEEELEPLAHELFREAWSERSTNPRSSLLIGMAALEVGIKQYISACVPDATWFVENSPSPDVVKMLREYLPTLQPPGAGTPLQPFEDALLDVLMTAVTIRNRLAHRGADVAHARLLPTLRAIRNVLWKLDEARGHAWAAQHLFPSLDKDLPVGYRRL
jgi:hypothetical protein